MWFVPRRGFDQKSEDSVRTEVLENPQKARCLISLMIGGSAQKPRLRTAHISTPTLHLSIIVWLQAVHYAALSEPVLHFLAVLSRFRLLCALPVTF